MKHIFKAICSAFLLAGFLAPLSAQMPVLPADAAAQYQNQLGTLRLSPAMQQYVKSIPEKFTEARTQAEAKINAARVAQDMIAADADGAAGFVHYAVPALSNTMRLEQVYPFDGTFAGEVRTIMAADEYEASSFQLFPLKDMTVEFEVNDLKTKDGAVFPKSALDLKVVKIWYQCGNAWFSYFSDPSLVPVPELLLKDENLVRVDRKNPADYVRVRRNGKEQYVWITPDQKIDSSYREHEYLAFHTFFPFAEEFKDAETLQPVTLNAGEFKQMWLTAHAVKEQKPGIYRGAISVKSNGKKVADVPVAIRVLPFVLPEPMRPDLKDKFLVSLYSGPDFSRITNGGDHELAKKQMLAVLKNYKAHNLLNPMLSPVNEEILQVYQEAGLSTEYLVLGEVTWFGVNTDYLPEGTRTKVEQRTAEYEKILKRYGNKVALAQQGDEPGGAWVYNMREVFRIYEKHGMPSYTAGHDGIFNKGGFCYGAMPLAMQPENPMISKMMNVVGDCWVGFYAVQHNGSENPDYVRRQHGMAGYSNGLGWIINYEFGWGGWNDLQNEGYKPMILAYTCSNGLIDTLEWEGFREAVDDVRYATMFKQEAERCKKSPNVETRYAGKQALMWYADTDWCSTDLNNARLEMIEYILKLRAMR